MLNWGQGSRAFGEKKKITERFWLLGWCYINLWERSTDSETVLTGDYNSEGYNHIHTGKLSAEREVLEGKPWSVWKFHPAIINDTFG